MKDRTKQFWAELCQAQGQLDLPVEAELFIFIDLVWPVLTCVKVLFVNLVMLLWPKWDLPSPSKHQAQWLQPLTCLDAYLDSCFLDDLYQLLFLTSYLDDFSFGLVFMTCLDELSCLLVLMTFMEAQFWHPSEHLNCLSHVL